MRSWCFTHNNFDYPASELPVFEHERYVAWQHEKVDTDHIQGYIELTGPQRLSALLKWLPGAHFEKRRGTADQARKYCMEEDTRVEGPWERGVFGGRQGKRSDVDEVVDAVKAGMSKREIYYEHSTVAAKYPRFIESIIAMEKESAVPKILEFTPKFPYQEKVLSIIKEVPDSRSIHWVYDPIGNHGKTYLAKFLVDVHSAYYSNGGKAVDLLYAYSGQSIVIFDYVRDSEEYVGYGVIEQLKNGIAMSTKYESVTKRYSIPHVFVFANFKPNETKFSGDRLKLITL